MWHTISGDYEVKDLKYDLSICMGDHIPYTDVEQLNQKTTIKLCIHCV